MTRPEFKRGEKGLVYLKPTRVTIRTARRRWYCDKCSRIMREGELHGVSKDSRHFCLNCIEPVG